MQPDAPTPDEILGLPGGQAMAVAESVVRRECKEHRGQVPFPVESVLDYGFSILAHGETTVVDIRKAFILCCRSMPTIAMELQRQTGVPPHLEGLMERMGAGLAASFLNGPHRDFDDFERTLRYMWRAFLSEATVPHPDWSAFKRGYSAQVAAYDEAGAKLVIAELERVVAARRRKNEAAAARRRRLKAEAQPE